MLKNELQYVVIDVDGTMTDAGIYYDEKGNELKKFCTRDAAAIFVAHKLGIKIIVITGRKCQATEMRMKELKIDFLFQDVKDKFMFLSDFMQKHGIKSESIAYIGDDLNDIEPMTLVGYKACPEDACKEVKAICNYISDIKGGTGAVRDVFEKSLCKDEWNNAIQGLYKVGI